MISWMLSQDTRFLWQKQRLFITHGTASNMYTLPVCNGSPCFSPLPCPTTGRRCSGGGYQNTVGRFVSQLRNPKCRKPKYLLIGNKQIYLTFPPQWDTTSCFWGCLPFKLLWKDSPEQGNKYLPLQGMQKYEKLIENCLPTFRFRLLNCYFFLLLHWIYIS